METITSLNIHKAPLPSSRPLSNDLIAPQTETSPEGPGHEEPRHHPVQLDRVPSQVVPGALHQSIQRLWVHLSEKENGPSLRTIEEF